MPLRWFAVFKTTGGSASARTVDHFLMFDTEMDAETISSPGLASGLALAPPAPETFDPQAYPEAEYDLFVDSATGIVTAVAESEALEIRQARATLKIGDLVAEAKQYLALDKRISLARRAQWVDYIEDLNDLKDSTLWNTDPEDLVYPSKPSTVDDSSLTVEQQINAGQTLDYGAVNVLKQFVADRTNMIPEFDFEDEDTAAFTVRVGKRTWNATTQQWVYSKNEQVTPTFINSRRSGGKALRILLPAGCNWMEVFGQAINFASVRGGNSYVIDADYAVRVPTGTVPYQANAGVQTYNGNGPTKTHTGNTYGTRDGVSADQTYTTRTIDKLAVFPATARWMTGWLEVQGDVDFPAGTEIEIESIAIRRAITYLDIAPGTVVAKDYYQTRDPSAAQTVENTSALTAFAMAAVVTLTPITGPFGPIPADVSFCANVAFGTGTAANLDVRITKQAQGGTEVTLQAFRFTQEGNRPDTKTYTAVDETPGSVPVTYRLRMALVNGAVGQVASFTYGDRNGRVHQLRG